MTRKERYTGKSKNMISRLNRIIIIFLLLILGGCSFYSFKGSIPAHIKSVYIAPIDNITMESSVSDIIKFELEQSFITENVLKLLLLPTKKINF